VEAQALYKEAPLVVLDLWEVFLLVVFLPVVFALLAQVLQELELCSEIQVQDL
jgi:hypothetical protein